MSNHGPDGPEREAEGDPIDGSPWSTPGSHDATRPQQPPPPPPPPPPGQAGWPGPPGAGGYGAGPPGWPGYGGEQQPPPGPYGWNYQPYGQGPPRTEPLAVWALICAIGSFVVCPVLPAIAALVLAPRAKRNIEQSRGTVTGDGLVTGARIIAWINLGLAALGLALMVLALIAAIAGHNSGEFEFNLRRLASG